MARTETTGVPRDPYEVLGLPRDATDQQIKKSFRQLARELHPDVNAHDPQAEEKFKEAAEAYEILSDAERRATYDRYGHEGLRSGGYAPNFDAFGSIGDLFNAFFGGGGFGGAFGGRPGPAMGADVAAAVEIDLVEAAHGAKVDVVFDAIERCEHCHGNGAEPGTPIEEIAVDRVFIGSCTNARIEDLRAAAAVLAGRMSKVPGLVSPGSTSVKRQAQEEGLDRIFRDAGLEWGESGCSMCVGINGDLVPPGERCASTTNRNFRGRQGPLARTHLMSPAMVAAAAVTGRLCDVRPLIAGCKI